jgi:hypothetical protein
MNISISVIARDGREKPSTSSAILDQETVKSLALLSDCYKKNNVFVSFAEILATVIREALKQETNS